MIEADEFLDFVYIGAPRAGSTWLSLALSQHPGLWVPHNKEIHFFNDRSLFPHEQKYSKGLQYYRDSFAKAPVGARLGELSPLYYFDPKVAGRLYKHFPNVKIIAFLRNPVEVIYSLYLRIRCLYKRQSSFEAEINKYPEYIDLGFYSKNLTRYFDRFPKENILVYIYDEFFSNQEDNIHNIYKFIGVNPRFTPSVIGRDINVTRVDYSPLKARGREQVIKMLHKKPFIFLKNVINHLELNIVENKMLTTQNRHEVKKPALAPAMRKSLTDIFLEDIEHLEQVLEKDLTAWKT